MGTAKTGLTDPRLIPSPAEPLSPRDRLKISEPVLHCRTLFIATLFPSVYGAKFREDFLKRFADFLKLLFVHAALSDAGRRAHQHDCTSLQPRQRDRSPRSA